MATGIPASWDSCTASIGGGSPHCFVWSPCGQFIAAGFGTSVRVLNSTTLGRVSTLLPPFGQDSFNAKSLAFSPDGHLLACSFGYPL